jgi:hypothetical protein
MSENHIFQLANQLFTKPPGPPHSWQLEMDLDQEDAATIAEVLVILFSRGVLILFAPEAGSKVDITAISEQNFALLRKYYASLGFWLNLNIQTWSGAPKGAHFQHYGPQLADVAFCLYRNDKLYQLSFDFMPKEAETCSTGTRTRTVAE